MGNAKSNSYWEADLPPDYDRVGMENFIRSKYDLTKLLLLSVCPCLLYNLGLGVRMLLFSRYQDKRWVPKYAKAKSTGVSEEKGSVFRGRPGSGGWQGYTKHIEYSSEERKDSHPLTINNTINFSGSSVPAPFEVSHRVCVVYILFFIWMRKSYDIRGKLYKFSLNLELTDYCCSCY